MIRDISLIDHLPPFLQKYREFNIILGTENPEFQLTADESERIKDDQFILSSSKDGLIKFERLLNINVSKDEILESRRSRVMSRWNDISPYTYHALLSKLLSLHDSDNFIINRLYDQYVIEIITHLEIAGQVDELDRMLDYIMPANLDVISENKIYFHAESVAYVYHGVSHCQVIEFSDSYHESFDLEGQSTVVMGHSHASIHEMTDSYSETVNVTGTNEIGSNIIGTMDVMVTDSYDEELNLNNDSHLSSNLSSAQIIEVRD